MNEQPMITVEARDVYGQLKFYPKCEQAKLFAAIANTTTLTQVNLRRIKQLGYLLDIEVNKPNLVTIGEL